MTEAETTEHLTAGIDPGAGAVKVAIMRSRAGDEGEILAKGVERIRRRNVADVARGLFESVCEEAGVAEDEFHYVASTGDGDAVAFRTGHFYSMTTHARGALFLDPEARAALDVGALHARAIRMDGRSKVLAQKMTSQCASGTGQFVENIARYLGVPLDDVGQESLEATDPEQCSSICAVLAETDVINMVSRGIETADILKGIHLSIAGRLVKLLRAADCEGTVMITGGMARNEGLMAAMHEVLEKERAKREKRGRPVLDIDLKAHPDSMLAGALGAALLGAYRHRQLEEQDRLPAA